MIVLSASMKKAGSGWYFNLTNDLIVAAGGSDVRALRERYRLHPALQGGNCQVNRSQPLAAARVLLPHVRGETFVVKTHGRPWWAVRAGLAAGVFRATYIYRDPRDVVLSILDHGRKLREAGPSANAAAALGTVEQAASYVERLVEVWEEWAACGAALPVRYEDLVAEPQAEAERLAGFLHLDLSAAAIGRVVERYRGGGQTAADRRNLHVGRGGVRRFETEMGPRDRALCERRFRAVLPRMGYA